MKECWHGGAGFAFKNGWAGAAGSSLGAGSEGVKTFTSDIVLNNIGIHKTAITT